MHFGMRGICEDAGRLVVTALLTITLVANNCSAFEPVGSLMLAGAAANEAIGLDAPPVTIPLATTASLLYAVRHPLMHFATAATESLLSMDMVKTVLSHSSIQATVCRVVRPELGDYQQQMEDTINVGELVKELASVRGQMAAREEKLMDNIQKLRKRMKEAATLERDTVDQAERGDDWDTLVLSEISFPSLAAPTPWDHTLAMVSERVTKLGAEVVSLKKANDDERSRNQKLLRYLMDAQGEIRGKNDEIVFLSDKLLKSVTDARLHIAAKTKEINTLKENLQMSSSDSQRDIAAKDKEISIVKEKLQTSFRDSQRDIAAKGKEITHFKQKLQDKEDEKAAAIKNARACDTRNSELLANNDRLLTESKKLSSHCADAFARDVVNEDRQSCKEFGQNTSHFATFVNGLEEKLKLCEESRPTTASRLGYCILPFLTFLAGWLYRWHLIILSWGWWILRKFFLEVIAREFGAKIMCLWLRVTVELRPEGNPQVVNGDAFQQGVARLARNCTLRAGDLRFQGYGGFVRAVFYDMLEQALIGVSELYVWLLT